MQDSSNQTTKWNIAKKLKELDLEQTNIEFKLIIVDQNLEIIKIFKSRNQLPLSVLEAIRLGEAHLLVKCYNLASALFDVIAQMYDLLIQKIEIKKNCKKCFEK